MRPRVAREMRSLLLKVTTTLLSRIVVLFITLGLALTTIHPGYANRALRVAGNARAQEAESPSERQARYLLSWTSKQRKFVSEREEGQVLHVVSRPAGSGDVFERWVVSDNGEWRYRWSNGVSTSGNEGSLTIKELRSLRTKLEAWRKRRFRRDRPAASGSNYLVIGVAVGGKWQVRSAPGTPPEFLRSVLKVKSIVTQE
jgi:hypothetical protein